MADRRLVPGLILIALGVLFLLVQQTGLGGEAVVAVIGGAFLVAYAFTRNYGFLIPGAIMTGLGIGIIYAAGQAEGAPAILLGLGAGFVAIYVLDATMRARPGGWWPLIPGGVLAVIGLLLAAGQEGALGAIGRWWPAALILIGLYILWRRRQEPEA